MDGFIRLVGPNQAAEIFGIRLVGINVENGKKLLATLLLIAIVFLLKQVIRLAANLVLRHFHGEQAEFWIRQVIQLITGFLLLLGFASIWFDDPARLATSLPSQVG